MNLPNALRTSGSSMVRRNLNLFLDSISRMFPYFGDILENIILRSWSYILQFSKKWCPSKTTLCMDMLVKGASGLYLTTTKHKNAQAGTCLCGYSFFSIILTHWMLHYNAEWYLCDVFTQVNVALSYQLSFSPLRLEVSDADAKTTTTTTNKQTKKDIRTIWTCS